MREAAATIKRSLPVFGSGNKGGIQNQEGGNRPHLVADALASGNLKVRPSLAENFLFVGSSAFLLLTANLFPDCWFFSFFALIPFLYRIARLDECSSFRLGLLFGLTFFPLLKIDGFLTAPASAFLNAVFGTALFSLFAWILARAKQKFGFNPLFAALFWVLFEYSLLKLNLLSDAGAGYPRPFLIGTPPYFHGLSVLFGFLAVSFVIVLVNSALVFAIERIVALAKARGQGAWEGESVWDLTPIPGLFAQKVYSLDIIRGPPLHFISSWLGLLRQNVF